MFLLPAGGLKSTKDFTGSYARLFGRPLLI